MHTRRIVVVVVALCSLLVAIWLLPEATASEGGREAVKPHAEMALGADRIDWQPTGDYEQIILTIAGPEELRLRKEFADGQPASLSLFDQEGKQLPDGTYLYELRLMERKAGPLSERLQAGSFVVRNGGFASPFEATRPSNEMKSVQEPAIKKVTAAEEIIPDDLVVQGGACIGTLCGSGNASGNFLRLKGSMGLGIIFEDVFDQITYDRDWSILVNSGNENVSLVDIDSGTVPFSVFGASPDYSLVVGSGGKIGIGTALPSVRLDVKTSAAGQATARLQNSSASGYSGTEYLDNAGNVDLFFGIDNGASTTRLNSINSNPIVMLTNSTEHVRIDSDGDVGINCNNPTSDLVIASGSGCSTPSSSINAGSTSFTVSSSRTIKQNLSPVQVPAVLDKIAKVGVFRYDFIQGPKDRLGLMAEDFHQVFERGTDKLIDGQEVQMALWLAVQELTALNRELTDQNMEIRKRLADLEAHLPAAPQQ